MAKTGRPSGGASASARGAKAARGATAARTVAEATPEGRAVAVGSAVASSRQSSGSKKSSGSAPAAGRPKHAKSKSSGGGLGPGSRVHSAATGGVSDLKGGATSAGKGIEGAVTGKANRALLAEFVICMAVLGLGTMVPTPAGRPKEGVPHLMVKGTGLALLFFVLSLTAAVGDRSRRAAGGLGAVVTVGYLATSPDAYNIVHWITGFYAKPGSSGAGITEAAARNQDLITYTPAVPYPWVVQSAPPGTSGPPAAASTGGGELVA